MKEDTTIIPFRHADSIEDPLTEIAREGARRMLAEALKAEADAFVARFADDVLPDGRQRVVRHGFGPERSVQTGIGAIDVRRPKSLPRTLIRGPGPSPWSARGRQAALHLEHSAEMGAAHEEPRCAAAGALPRIWSGAGSARHLHRRLPGGAGRDLGAGRAEPRVKPGAGSVAGRGLQADRGVGRRGMTPGSAAISRPGVMSFGTALEPMARSCLT